jgi:cytosine/uracil/thiamine/allantoin permease
MALTRYSIEIYGYSLVVWAIASVHYRAIDAKLHGNTPKIKRKSDKKTVIAAISVSFWSKSSVDTC